MRCGCPHCDTFMIQSDGTSCICPHCGYRCNACLGTNTVISREELQRLKDTDWFKPGFQSPTSDEDELQNAEMLEQDFKPYRD